MLNQVYQTLGQNEPGTNYPLKTPIKAFVTNFDKEKYDPKTGKVKSQKLYLRDEQNEIAEVYLKGNFTPLKQAGEWFDFLVWPFKPEDVNKIYLMCWIQNQKTVQNAPQPTPQASYNGPQSMNSTQDGDMLTKIYNVLQAILESYLMSLPEGQRMAKQFENEQGLNEEMPDDTDIPY